MSACQARDCERDATVAIRTQRPTRANLWTKVWWDEREAPKAADRLCAEHAAETLTSLTKVLA